MATLIKDLIPIVRNRLIEPTPNYWSDAELVEIAGKGIKDLWRDIVDLKQEHYLVIDVNNVSYPSASTTLLGVPLNVHKVYMIEPRDLSETGNNHGLKFTPLPYNHRSFQQARSMAAVEPTNAELYYAIHKQGAPVGAPEIQVAPKVSSAVPLAFTYVPTLGGLDENTKVPIPGEADNAIVAWTVAFARSKEREDRSPDEAWLAIYGTEKQHLLQSLGLRQYQEPTYADAVWQEYW